MRKSIFKFIIIMMAVIFLAVGILTSVVVINGRQIAVEQAEDSLQMRCENCANQFRAVFDNADLIANDTASVAERIFVVEDCRKSNVLLKENCKEMDAIVSEIVENSRYPISVCITLNLEYFFLEKDIWHIKNLDGSVNAIEYEADNEDAKEWLKMVQEKENDYAEFYWDIIENDEVWFETYYETEYNWDVVTKGMALHDKNGDLIGILSAEMYVGDISKTMKQMDDETGGTSSLVDKKNRMIAGSRIDTTAKNCIYATDNINEHWVITLQQPMKVALKSMTGSAILSVTLAVLLFIGIGIAIWFLYKRHGQPIIREFEEKDLLLVNQSRQAQMGEMVGNVAHQLKQPLNGVNMALANLREDYADEVEDAADFEERINRIKMRISNMSETVDGFMSFLRPRKENEVFSVHEAVEHVVSLMEERLRLNLIQVDIQGEDFFVNGHKNELGQCLFNILDNARDALEKTDNKQIRITLEDGKIHIWNNGPAIDESVLNHLFDLYFTTKESSAGYGIGLYLTKKIIESHFSGTIWCRNCENGVCFTIELLKEEELEHECIE